MNLNQLRRKIEQIDRQILNLLNQRLELARQIGRAKANAGQDIFDPVREMALLDKLQKLKSSSIPYEALQAIYREIFSLARSVQKQLTIGYAGATGSPIHMAAFRIFGACSQYKKIASRTAAQKAFSKRQCDYWITAQKPDYAFQTVSKIKEKTGGKTFYILKAKIKFS